MNSPKKTYLNESFNFFERQKDKESPPPLFHSPMPAVTLAGGHRARSQERILPSPTWQGPPTAPPASSHSLPWQAAGLGVELGTEPMFIVSHFPNRHLNHSPKAFPQISRPFLAKHTFYRQYFYQIGSNMNKKLEHKKNVTGINEITSISF